MAKQAANTSKQEQAVAKMAMVGFNRSGFRKALNAIGGAHDAETENRENRSAAAFGIVQLASEFRAKNDSATPEAVAKAWSEYVAAELPGLAKSGNRYVDVTEATADKPAQFRLTGYGNNVVSTGRGVCEFGIVLTDAPVVMDDGSLDHAASRTLDSYRETERVVKAYRAEKRAETDPDSELRRVAKAECDAAWSALRKLVFETGDVAIISGLTEALAAQFDHVAGQLAEAEAIETAAAEAA